MFKFEDVKTVYIEMTDRCNAACPMCARFVQKPKSKLVPNPNLKNIEITLDDAKAMLPRDVLLQLKRIYLCGNFGDPIVAKDTLEVLRYFRAENPQIELGIHTNGSARAREWWTELGRILSGPRDYCKFGIDGLEDTNHLYRRKTSWPKIMESVTSFIAAGGKAHWEFLVFKHNEHQIDQARELAASMGFAAFFPKRTARFLYNDMLEVTDNFGKPAYTLEMPTDPRFVHPLLDETMEQHNALIKPLREPKRRPQKKTRQALKPKPQLKPRPKLAPKVKWAFRLKFRRVLQTFSKSQGRKFKQDGWAPLNVKRDRPKKQARQPEPKTFAKPRTLTQICCQALNEQSIYIAASGLVFPCCFLGEAKQRIARNPERVQLLKLIRAHARQPSRLDAKLTPLREIVEGRLFRAIVETWTPKRKEAVLETCVRQCSLKTALTNAEHIDPGATRGAV